MSRAALLDASGTKRLLQRELGGSWRFAHRLALGLTRQVEHLSWRERGAIFDQFFVRQADDMLRTHGVSELIDDAVTVRVDPDARRAFEERAGRFAHWSRAIVTAVLLDLNERPEVATAEQALTYLLTREPVFARAAARWTGWHGKAGIERLLHDLPGYALVLLAASPNDTASRFLARDAFWAAIRKSG